MDDSLNAWQMLLSLSVSGSGYIKCTRFVHRVETFSAFGGGGGGDGVHRLRCCTCNSN